MLNNRLPGEELEDVGQSVERDADAEERDELVEE